MNTTSESAEIAALKTELANTKAELQQVKADRDYYAYHMGRKEGVIVRQTELKGDAYDTLHYLHDHMVDTHRDKMENKEVRETNRYLWRDNHEMSEENIDLRERLAKETERRMAAEAALSTKKDGDVEMKDEGVEFTK